MIIDTSVCDNDACDCEQPQWWSGWVGNTVHVVPVADIHPHTTPRCGCNPTREMVVTDDGRHGFSVWHVIHNSHDRRD